MNQDLSGYTLEKFAEGRYDVRLDNGSRAGSIIGGKSTWQAEIGQRVLDSQYKSRKLAAEAILADAKIVPIWEQMRRIVERPDALLVAYKNDFYVHDKNALLAWKSAADLIWIVRESGTDLIPLDMPKSKRDVTDMIDCRVRSGGPYEVYHIDQGATKVRRITNEKALELARRGPSWEVHAAKDSMGNVRNGSMSRNGTIVADFSAKSVAVFGRGYAGEIEVLCRSEPSEKTLAILNHLAFSSETSRQGTLFAKVKSLVIRHNGKIVDSWEPALEKQAA